MQMEGSLNELPSADAYMSGLTAWVFRIKNVHFAVKIRNVQAIHPYLFIAKVKHIQLKCFQ